MNLQSDLYNYALENIWGNPSADAHATFKCVQLNTDAGTIGTLISNFGTFPLPESTVPFIVYLVTNQNPTHLSLDPSMLNGWKRLSEVLNLFAGQETFIQAFKNGRFTARDRTYIGLTKSGTIMVAVDISVPVNSDVTAGDDPFFLRFYTNAGVSNPNLPVLPHNRYFSFYNGAAATFAEYSTFQSTLPSFTNNIRPYWVFYNGILQVNGNLPVFTDLQPEDYLEVIYHHHLNAVEMDWFTSEQTFTSTADGNQKVIFSTGDLNNNAFVDDIEFYVTGIDNTSGNRVGLYYPRLFSRDIRQLTFKDYSLNATRLEQLQDDLLTLYPSIDQWQILAYIRTTRLQRLGNQDIERLRDLERLPEEIRTGALTGVNATYGPWQAPSLEQNTLNRFMDTEGRDLVVDDVAGLYTRQSAIEAMQLLKFDEDNSVWRAPYLADNSSFEVIDWDTDGKRLLTGFGSSSFINRDQIITDAQGTELLLPGTSVNVDLDIVRPSNDATPIVIDSRFGFKAYYDAGDGTPVLGVNEIDYDFVDDGTNITIQWKVNRLDKVRYVRTADKRIHYRRTITEQEYHDRSFDLYNGLNVDFLNVGMERLYIWLFFSSDNGILLTEGLDFYVDGREVFITKAIAESDVPFTIEVLYCGLPNDDLEYTSSNYWGFVQDGRVSVGDGYTLLRNRNLMLVIDGRVVPPTEEYIYNDYPIPSSFMHEDGDVYNFVEYPTFIRNDLLDQLTETDNDSIIKDEAIETYINAHWEEVPLPPIITIGSPYDVVSPFLEQIIIEVREGRIDIPGDNFSDEYVLFRVSEFTDLLDFDITQQDLDFTFLEINPWRQNNTVGVTDEEYAFISRVNELVLFGRVSNLNVFLTIGNGNDVANAPNDQPIGANDAFRNVIVADQGPNDPRQLFLNGERGALFDNVLSTVNGVPADSNVRIDGSNVDGDFVLLNAISLTSIDDIIFSNRTWDSTIGDYEVTRFQPELGAYNSYDTPTISGLGMSRSLDSYFTSPGAIYTIWSLSGTASFLSEGEIDLGDSILTASIFDTVNNELTIYSLNRETGDISGPVTTVLDPGVDGFDRVNHVDITSSEQRFIRSAGVIDRALTLPELQILLAWDGENHPGAGILTLAGYVPPALFDRNDLTLGGGISLNDPRRFFQNNENGALFDATLSNLNAAGAAIDTEISSRFDNVILVDLAEDLIWNDRDWQWMVGQNIWRLHYSPDVGLFPLGNYGFPQRLIMDRPLDTYFSGDGSTYDKIFTIWQVGQELELSPSNRVTFLNNPTVKLSIFDLTQPPSQVITYVTIDVVTGQQFTVQGPELDLLDDSDRLDLLNRFLNTANAETIQTMGIIDRALTVAEIDTIRLWSLENFTPYDGTVNLIRTVTVDQGPNDPRQLFVNGEVGGMFDRDLSVLNSTEILEDKDRLFGQTLLSSAVRTLDISDIINTGAGFTSTSGNPYYFDSADQGFYDNMPRFNSELGYYYTKISNNFPITLNSNFDYDSVFEQSDVVFTVWVARTLGTTLSESTFNAGNASVELYQYNFTTNQRRRLLVTSTNINDGNLDYEAPTVIDTGTDPYYPVNLDGSISIYIGTTTGVLHNAGIVNRALTVAESTRLYDWMVERYSGVIDTVFTLQQPIQPRPLPVPVNTTRPVNNFIQITNGGLDPRNLFINNERGFMVDTVLSPTSIVQIAASGEVNGFNVNNAQNLNSINDIVRGALTLTSQTPPTDTQSIRIQPNLGIYVRELTTPTNLQLVMNSTLDFYFAEEGEFGSVYTVWEIRVEGTFSSASEVTRGNTTLVGTIYNLRGRVQRSITVDGSGMVTISNPVSMAIGTPTIYGFSRPNANDRFLDYTVPEGSVEYGIVNAGIIDRSLSSTELLNLWNWTISQYGTSGTVITVVQDIIADQGPNDPRHIFTGGEEGTMWDSQLTTITGTEELDDKDRNSDDLLLSEAVRVTGMTEGLVDGRTFGEAQPFRYNSSMDEFYDRQPRYHPEVGFYFSKSPGANISDIELRSSFPLDNTFTDGNAIFTHWVVMAKLDILSTTQVAISDLTVQARFISNPLGQQQTLTVTAANINDVALDWSNPSTTSLVNFPIVGNQFDAGYYWFDFQIIYNAGLVNRQLTVEEVKRFYSWVLERNPSANGGNFTFTNPDVPRGLPQNVPNNTSGRTPNNFLQVTEGPLDPRNMFVNDERGFMVDTFISPKTTTQIPLEGIVPDDTGFIIAGAENVTGISDIVNGDSVTIQTPPTDPGATVRCHPWMGLYVRTVDGSPLTIDYSSSVIPYFGFRGEFGVIYTEWYVSVDTTVVNDNTLNRAGIRVVGSIYNWRGRYQRDFMVDENGLYSVTDPVRITSGTVTSVTASTSPLDSRANFGYIDRSMTQAEAFDLWDWHRTNYGERFDTNNLTRVLSANAGPNDPRQFFTSGEPGHMLDYYINSFTTQWSGYGPVTTPIDGFSYVGAMTLDRARDLIELNHDYDIYDPRTDAVVDDTDKIRALPDLDIWYSRYTHDNADPISIDRDPTEQINPYFQNTINPFTAFWIYGEITFDDNDELSIGDSQVLVVYYDGAGNSDILFKGAPTDVAGTGAVTNAGVPTPIISNRFPIRFDWFVDDPTTTHWINHAAIIGRQLTAPEIETLKGWATDTLPAQGYQQLSGGNTNNPNGLVIDRGQYDPRQLFLNGEEGYLFAFSISEMRDAPGGNILDNSSAGTSIGFIEDVSGNNNHWIPEFNPPVTYPYDTTYGLLSATIRTFVQDDGTAGLYFDQPGQDYTLWRVTGFPPNVRLSVTRVDGVNGTQNQYDVDASLLIANNTTPPPNDGSISYGATSPASGWPMLGMIDRLITDQEIFLLQNWAVTEYGGTGGIQP